MRGSEHPLIRLVWCAINKLITGSKTERPVSALLSNFRTEALSRDVVSFVTSALASWSQSKLVRELHCLFLPLLVTSLRDLRLFIKKTSLNSSEVVSLMQVRQKGMLVPEETTHWPPVVLGRKRK